MPATDGELPGLKVGLPYTPTTLVHVVALEYNQVHESIQQTKEVSMSTLPSVQWLKPAEVADHFRVNRKTVYRWIEDKRLPSYDVGGAKRILRNDVLSFAVPTKTEGERL